MNIFKRLETYLYSGFAAAVTVWASHHPLYHDLALWFLGVIGTAIGVSHGANGISHEGPNGSA